MINQPELAVHVVSVNKLNPYANNAKIHSEEQVDSIVASMEEFGNCDPIAVWHNEAGEMEVVEGHGRLLALERLGIDEAPVIFLDHLTDEQRRAYCHVHNQTTLNSGFDWDVLIGDINELAGYDWEKFGFGDVELDEAATETALTEMAGLRGAAGAYSDKTEGLIYEPSGTKRPEIAELMDTSAYDDMMEVVRGAELSDESRAFFVAAATRFYKFDYEKIADWYPGASGEEKRVAENLALVIIDYDDMIKRAARKLVEKLERYDM